MWAGLTASRISFRNYRMKQLLKLTKKYHFPVTKTYMKERVFGFRKVQVSTRNKQAALQYMRAFKQELLNYKKTRHDNVELFLGACLTYPNLAIVTRNYRGWRLDTHMRESSPSLDHARMIAEHICQGLGYLHSRRIVHRDLRPANVMFDQAGKVHLFLFR